MFGAKLSAGIGLAVRGEAPGGVVAAGAELHGHYPYL
jgi:hypothetical protein